MMLRLLCFALVLTLASGQDETFPPDMSMIDLADYWGYDIEEHHITTTDGYILELHRLPRSHSESGTGSDVSAKQTFFIQHGLGSGSSRTLMGPPDNSIGYVLADAGYDVWLGNTRGNTYSRQHETYDPDVDQEEFWSYTIEDAATGDLPAVMDYILENTGNEKLFYVGSSMGSTEFLVAMSMETDHQQKVEAAFLMNPVAYMEYVTGILDTISHWWNPLENLFEEKGVWEIMSDKEEYSIIGHDYCDEDDFPDNEEYCLETAYKLFGVSEGQLNVTMLPWMFDYQSEGTSQKVIVHYGQIIDSDGHFPRYNYGDDESNEAVYGTPVPPDYDLGSIQLPVHLYWGDADTLATPNDVARLAEELPDVRNYYQVPYEGWTHNDFTLAIDARVLIYDVILEDLAALSN